MRHTVNAIVAVIALLEPASTITWAGRLVLGALLVWSAYRLLTRSPKRLASAVDYALAVTVCLAIPLLLNDPAFSTHNTAPQAIAGTAVVSFAVSLSARITLPMTVGIAAAYAVGSAGVVSWHGVADITALYYFALQWGTAAVIRLVLLKVAAAVDRVRTDRQAAELDQQVAEAVRSYEREQLALLHDTAASTLLMVGQGMSLPPDRLAAQARRDLALLDDEAWSESPASMDVVPALQQAASDLSTPVTIRGRSQLWLDGETAKAVVGAAREAMTNTDRHADATWLIIDIGAQEVVLCDDGVGFNPDAPRHRHGITESMIARMHRAGGIATITSALGAGTTVQLRWRLAPPPAPPVADDPDRLIERARSRYGVALSLYALANMGSSVPYIVSSSAHVGAEFFLLGLASLSPLFAVIALVSPRRPPTWLALSALMVVTVTQPLLLPIDELGGQAHWAQGAVGWCLVPLVLALPTPTGAGILVLFWIAGAVVQLMRYPSAEMVVNIGLGTASILSVQLFALVFNGLMRIAAHDAQAEIAAHQHLLRRERVASAVQAEYQRRYANLVDNVVPLLRALSDGVTVDDGLRRQARVESRKLRALFDQATTFHHPLIRRIRPFIDTAEYRGVDVIVDVEGTVPNLSDDAVDDLVDPLAYVFGLEMTAMRLVLSASEAEVCISIVCRGTTSAAADSLRSTISFNADVVEGENSVWILLRHRNPASHADSI